MFKNLSIKLLVALSCLSFWSSGVVAGPVFITGHDPDFHAQLETGAQNLLKIGLDYATTNTTFTTTEKFLWVESRMPPPGGHLNW
ncbi:MAG: hypothetical protein KUG79_18120 [Pseudomonadales bacterium]|nr:hypothetical protein [Pseudomonadales bacterium]